MDIEKSKQLFADWETGFDARTLRDDISHLTIAEVCDGSTLGRKVGKVIDDEVRENLAALWDSFCEEPSVVVLDDGIYISPALMEGIAEVVIPFDRMVDVFSKVVDEFDNSTEILLRWKSAIDGALDKSRATDTTR